MPLDFDPPLLNSATPWATTKEDLQSLYNCQYTGALTTRTCRTEGYPHKDNVHQYCLMNPEHTIVNHSMNQSQVVIASGGTETISSLNTLGYSPISFLEYINIVREMVSQSEPSMQKPIIFSVTGSAPQMKEYYFEISKLKSEMNSRLLMEINLSCPNIAGKPPPAYSEEELTSYLRALAVAVQEMKDSFAGHGITPAMEVGIKMPPYTYRDQFVSLISALRAVEPCPVSFITATNTLGSCLLLYDSLSPALNSETGTGIGGLGGATLHPLALGNVRTIRSMLDEHKQLRHISIIGVGGVNDEAGYRRMQSVGADAVAVGTGLGNEGLAIFKKIMSSAADTDMTATSKSSKDFTGLSVASREEEQDVGADLTHVATIDELVTGSTRKRDDNITSGTD
ncbi:MAG: hypothetical protein Q9191_004711 [Dirinaria sp. TL-2023a]